MQFSQRAPSNGAKEHEETPAGTSPFAGFVPVTSCTWREPPFLLPLPSKPCRSRGATRRRGPQALWETAWNTHINGLRQGLRASNHLLDQNRMHRIIVRTKIRFLRSHLKRANAATAGLEWPFLEGLVPSGRPIGRALRIRVHWRSLAVSNLPRQGALRRRVGQNG